MALRQKLRVILSMVRCAGKMQIEAMTKSNSLVRRVYIP